MSEYQYYEFRAIDRPLDEKEMHELRALSTRAVITPTSFTNTYHYGDFKGKPDALMDRYFDAFVYVANWGTHRLMFRIPAGLLDVEAASAYCDDEYLSVAARKKHVVIEFSSDDEMGDDWTEGEPWMPALITLRADLMRGDFRALYLGWLASLWSQDDDDVDGEDNDNDNDRLEPPVPAGLAKLSAPLRELADFLRVDAELIEVAAAGNVDEAPGGPTRADLARWVRGLPAAEKDAYLLRFAAEEGDIPLRAEMLKRHRETAATKGARPVPEARRRTAGQLLASRDALAAEKKQKAAQRSARERARLAIENAKARAIYLDELALREPATWREVDELIDAKKSKDYDRAVTLLVDLRELAGRSGREEEAERRIKELRQRHSTKSALLKRFNEMKLGK